MERLSEYIDLEDEETAWRADAARLRQALALAAAAPAAAPVAAPAPSLPLPLPLKDAPSRGPGGGGSSAEVPDVAAAAAAAVAAASASGASHDDGSGPLPTSSGSASSSGSSPSSVALPLPALREPPADWPRRGTLEFRAVRLAYACPGPGTGNGTGAEGQGQGEAKGKGEGEGEGLAGASASARASARPGGSPAPRLALRGVSFSVGEARVVGVCGRTGAGKSSLVQALARMRPFDGSVLLESVSQSLRPAPQSLCLSVCLCLPAVCEAFLLMVCDMSVSMRPALASRFVLPSLLLSRSGVDVASVPLARLRKSLAVIPQVTKDEGG